MKSNTWDQYNWLWTLTSSARTITLVYRCFRWELKELPDGTRAQIAEMVAHKMLLSDAPPPGSTLTGRRSSRGRWHATRSAGNLIPLRSRRWRCSSGRPITSA